MGINRLTGYSSSSPTHSGRQAVDQVLGAITFLRRNVLFEPVKRLDDLGEGALIAEAGSHLSIDPERGMGEGMYPSVRAFQLMQLTGELIKPLEPNEFHIRSVDNDGGVLYGMCVQMVLGPVGSYDPGAPLSIIKKEIAPYFDGDEGNGNKNPFRPLKFSDELLASGRFFRQKKPSPSPDYLSALLVFPPDEGPPDDFLEQLSRVR
ncbi:hypothetical protein HYV84_04130 [Candidatus Woesearchaeota archaeon]|nr:hypothetical protein [Candidatus Woesearchaeota archaeon]